jgi:hypothetical protein
MSRIFISYTREDTEKVRPIREFLAALGYDVWMDIYKLPPGSNFDLEIQKEIERCDYFIAILSHHSVDHRGYVQKEVKLALDEFYKIPEGKIYLVPVRLDECEVPHSLRSLTWVDMFQPGAKLKLLEAFMHPNPVDLDKVHRKMRKAELFSPEHNEGRIAYRRGDYAKAERFAREAYDNIPNPHSKLNEQVAAYAQGKIIKRQLDDWVYKLKLDDSGHGQSVLAKGF